VKKVQGFGGGEAYQHEASPAGGTAGARRRRRGLDVDPLDAFPDPRAKAAGARNQCAFADEAPDEKELAVVTNLRRVLGEKSRS